MILVDHAGGDWPEISHAPWNGCNLADFVMPFFLFIVGVAIALALKVCFKLLLKVFRRKAMCQQYDIVVLREFICWFVHAVFLFL